MQYLERYTPEQARRHDVRPGITGLAQVSGRNALTWEAKFAADSDYVRRRSLRLDATILWRTVLAVLAAYGYRRRRCRDHARVHGDCPRPQLGPGNRMTTPIVVVGAGGFGRETLDVVEAVNAAASQPAFEVLGVVDDAPSAENLVRLKSREVDASWEVSTPGSRRKPRRLHRGHRQSGHTARPGAAICRARADEPDARSPVRRCRLPGRRWAPARSCALACRSRPTCGSETTFTSMQTPRSATTRSSPTTCRSTRPQPSRASAQSLTASCWVQPPWSCRASTSTPARPWVQARASSETSRLGQQ